MTVSNFKYSITPEQAEQERRACYRQLNRQKRPGSDHPMHEFIYPKGSEMVIMTPNRLTTLDLSEKKHNNINKAFHRIRAENKIIETAYITIPSKANNQ